MTLPHLCHLFPTFDPGGPEVRTATLINASHGAFRQTVVSLDGGFSCQTRFLRKDAVSFVQAPPKVRQSLYPLALARMLRALKPDLVLTYNWGAIDGVLAARLCGIRRVIHAEDGFGPDEIHRQKLRRVLARRVILKGAARVVCPSLTLVRVARSVWRLQPSKVSYIPNGVDVRRFSPGPPGVAEEVRRRFGWAGSATVVGTVGHLREEKNQARLLRAFSMVADQAKARLLIVGGGPSREKLECLARELGVADHVAFMGVVGDPLDCYRAMDIFAVSSDTEQMPIAVLEAMSVGLPVVSTDVGDVRQMVSQPNWGYVVPFEKEATYAEALTKLLKDAVARVILGQANREKCLREYEQATMIQAYLDLYREVLETEYR